MRRALPLLTGLVCLPGCAGGSLRWQVERADRVSLQAVGLADGAIPAYDLDHPADVLPAGAEPRTVSAPFRSGTVPARRNADGSIDLLFQAGTWHVVGADGAVTPLRPDAHELPSSGTAWAFLGAPPSGFGVRTPWQLRLATPRENVHDARIVVRRDKVGGGVMLGLGAFAATFESVEMGWAVHLHDGPRAVPITFAAIGLVAAAVATGAGLHSLLLHEHDEEIASPVLYPR
jgi:hypothetical protein